MSHSIDYMELPIANNSDPLMSLPPTYTLYINEGYEADLFRLSSRKIFIDYNKHDWIIKATSIEAETSIPHHGVLPVDFYLL